MIAKPFKKEVPVINIKIEEDKENINSNIQPLKRTNTIKQHLEPSNGRMTSLKNTSDIAMPLNKAPKMHKPSQVENALLNKLQLKMGGSSIDRNIMLAALHPDRSQKKLASIA